MTLDYALHPSLQELARQATEVARAATSDLAVTEDSWLIGTSREFSLELAARGWLGMTWPTEWGGHGRSPIERFVVVEALIAEGAPIATSWFADRQIGPTLLQFGTDDQRRRWLPDIVAGTSAWCIGMSEPDAGSDVASIRTSAVQHNGPGAHEWVLNGAKVWTSGAAEADWCYLIARTDPDAPPHAGLSEFVLDMSSPGIEVRPIRDATGNNHFCEVLLDDVSVPANHLIGAPNDSFRQVMRQMEHERGGIDRLVSNRRLYLDARRARPTRRPPASTGTRPTRGGLRHRAQHGPARGPRTGSEGLVIDNEDLVHRVRAARRRGVRPDHRRRRVGVEPILPRRLLLTCIHADGWNHSDPPQHHRRANARVAPRTAALNRPPDRASLETPHHQIVHRRARLHPNVSYPRTRD